MSTRLLRTADLSLDDYLARLGSADAVPGGGSASGVAGALAAALVEMVVSLSEDRPRYAAYAETLRQARPAAEEARRRFLELAEEDAAAFTAYMEARALPRDDPQLVARRDIASRAAARQAAEVPLEMVRTARDLALAIEALAGRSNMNAASDLNVAALLVEAAARGAAANVMVNLPAVGDDAFSGRITADVEGFLYDIDHAARVTREQVGREQLRDPSPA